jgi:small subunit ribosomal protein S20
VNALLKPLPFLHQYGTVGALYRSLYMPITKGAEKAHRVSERKRVFNIRRKSAMKDAEKAIQKAVTAGDAKKAAELLPTAYKAIDKAAKRGVIKDNTASRKKSRITARVKNTK